MSDTLRTIPLAEIDDAALARDRTGLDPEPLAELRLSIATNGLRMPIEVFALAEPRGDQRYGLISGFRRLAVYRALLELTERPEYAAIPAFLREPADLAGALVAMVEENDIRADLSPWERGRVALIARDQGLFPTIEDAVDKLYPSANRSKRARLRALARLAEELDDHLTAPETLSLRQALRLTSALARGFGDLMRTALAEASDRSAQSQWQILLPILEEAEREAPDAPPASRPGRPRRTLQPRPGLVIRREMTRDGYLLRFTGREASSALLDRVLDEIEHLFSPA